VIPTAGLVATVIGSNQYMPTGEEEFRQLVASALVDAHLPVLGRAWISPSDRIDLLVGSVGVAFITSGGRLHVVAAQILRYANSRRLDGLVVVTTARILTRLPRFAAGKPLIVIYIGQAVMPHIAHRPRRI
jgi:hypothetical protein